MSNNYVYSFYEPISGWAHDKKLVDLWISNWKDRGFEPIILSKSDAESHPYYEEFVENIFKMFQEFSGRSLLRANPWAYYIFHNYIRFLAYAHQLPDKEPNLVMDYDVYNLDYHEHQLNGESLTFLCNLCPCLVSGTGEQFFKYCEWMANGPARYIAQLKEANRIKKYTAFHEMAMLTLMCEIGKQPQEINITRRKVILKTAPGETQAFHKLVHLSRGYFEKVMEGIGKSSYGMSFHDMIEVRYEHARKEIEIFKPHN